MFSQARPTWMALLSSDSCHEKLKTNRLKLIGTGQSGALTGEVGNRSERCPPIQATIMIAGKGETLSMFLHDHPKLVCHPPKPRFIAVVCRDLDFSKCCGHKSIVTDSAEKGTNKFWICIRWGQRDRGSGAGRRSDGLQVEINIVRSQWADGASDWILEMICNMRLRVSVWRMRIGQTVFRSMSSPRNDRKYPF